MSDVPFLLGVLVFLVVPVSEVMHVVIGLATSLPNSSIPGDLQKLGVLVVFFLTKSDLDTRGTWLAIEMGFLRKKTLHPPPKKKITVPPSKMMMLARRLHLLSLFWGF